jgi:hypothetical protein
MDSPAYAAFSGHRRLAHGSLLDVARAVFAHGDGAVQIFDETGHPVELDTRNGPEAAVTEFLQRTTAPETRSGGRGRPRLGVVAREVTLLPRHWDWLAAQPGGASAALRRLVEEARGDPTTRQREARDRLYRVMSALAGDLPAFEEATRALYAGDDAKFAAIVSAWPVDVADYLVGLKPA